MNWIIQLVLAAQSDIAVLGGVIFIILLAVILVTIKQALES